MATKKNHSAEDIRYMHYAIALAERGLGRCAPNPSVGCVIVKDGVILAAAHTADGGRPHAEKLALDIAGEKAQGATAYVTLEPCAHHGKTPPCANALKDAGIALVVVGVNDPDPRVSGKGIEKLLQAGIEVITGVLEQDCSRLNRGFFLTQTHERPFITLKTAMSLDGKIALNSGQSQWITGNRARQKAHQLRSQHDAILCGINTVTHDDPMLTTRSNGLVHKTVRIIVDSALRIGIGSHLVQSSFNEPLWIIHASKDHGRIGSIEQAGAKLFYNGNMDLKETLKLITQQGVTRLLVEGGAKLHSSFINSGYFDELALFRSGKILGQGKDAFGDYIAADINDALQLKLRQTIVLGSDQLEIYENMRA